MVGTGVAKELAKHFIVYDNFKLDITEYTLESDNLPESFNEFKIIHLSDLHNTEFGEDNKKLLKIIKEQKPDAVFVTGDTIDGFYTNTAIPINLFKEVLKICDVYLVVGNHESRVNINVYTEFIDTLNEIGVIVLKDNSAYIEKGKETIEREVKKLGIKYSDLVRPEWLQLAMDRYKFATVEDLYASIIFFKTG